MDNKKQQIKEIERLQDNLAAIRKIAGWTSEQFGRKIGVTKQTISNLENKKTPMTLTQYIAIRAVIDYEIQTNEENKVLPQVIEILLNRDEDYTQEEYEKISESVKTIAATAAGGIGGAALAAVCAGVLGGVFAGPVAAIGGVVAGSTWLSKLLKEKRNGKDD